MSMKELWKNLTDIFTDVKDYKEPDSRGIEPTKPWPNSEKEAKEWDSDVSEDHCEDGTSYTFSGTLEYKLSLSACNIGKPVMIIARKDHRPMIECVGHIKGFMGHGEQVYVQVKLGTGDVVCHLPNELTDTF